MLRSIHESTNSIYRRYLIRRLILFEEKVLKSGQAKKRRTQLEAIDGAIISLSRQSPDILRTGSPVWRRRKG